MTRSDATRSGKSGSSGGKKVTTACDTCRLKRQKCDGAQPECASCLENHIPCTYSRQTRRRGPPLGYLRHVEVRLHIADAFLGFVIVSEPALLSTFQKYADVMAASTLIPSSKTGPEADSTTLKWDEWNTTWRESQVSRLLDSLSAKFATPVSRPEVESPLRTGPAGSAGSNHPGLSLSSRSVISPHTPTSPSQLRTTEQDDRNGGAPYNPFDLSAQDDSSLSPDTLVSSSSQFPPDLFPPSQHATPYPLHQPDFNFTHSLLPWSQDLAMADLISDAQSAAPAPQPLPPSSSTNVNPPLALINDTINFDFASSLAQYPWLPTSAQSKGNELQTLIGSDTHGVPGTGGIDVSETDTVRYKGAATGMHHQALDASYTGSFWRTQASYTLDDAQPKEVGIRTTSAPQLSSSTSTLSTSIELPPIQVQHHLAEVYLQNVHPLFPLLSRTAILNRTSKSTNLILALCAYCASISPTLGVEDSAAFASGVGDATRIAADMWYEQARSTVMNQSIRRPSDLDTIQTVLFLVLRDQGRGKESQAWLLMGMVVRMSEDLGLHLNSSAWVDVPDNIKDMRRRVWGVVCIVDLLISLQLGRPSSILDPQWASEIPISPPPPPDAGLPGSLETYTTPTPHYFAYTASLCLIISRINFQLYLCGNTTEVESLERLNMLKGELDAWHAHLPSALRISIGHTASLPVLDVNLLYHAAVILLYRPFRLNLNIPAVRVSLDAASTFNVLLSYYRTIQRYDRSNPHLIYLIFTAAIAHLSGVRSLRDLRSSSASSLSSATLNAQYNLLSCVEALKDVSSSWPLAERCHRIMMGLMEIEGLGGIQKETLENNAARPPPFSGGGTSPVPHPQHQMQLSGGGSGHHDSVSPFSFQQYPQSYSRGSPVVLSSPGALSTGSSSPSDRRRQRSDEEILKVDTISSNSNSSNNKRSKSSHFYHHPAPHHSQHHDSSRHRRPHHASLSSTQLAASTASFETHPTPPGSSSASLLSPSPSAQHRYSSPQLAGLNATTTTTSSSSTSHVNAPSNRNSRTGSANNSGTSTPFRLSSGGETYLPDFDLFAGTGWAALDYDAFDASLFPPNLNSD